jgi:nucleoid-associated protein YgaU
MSLSRYNFSTRRKNLQGKSIISNSNVSYVIYNAIESGSLDYTVKILESGERLDTIAGVLYGDSSLWWVIAAASGIGWGLQVPPGTVLRIPNSPSEVMGLIV